MAELRDVELPDPWDQQPGETDAAYAAFNHYRDLQPHERSLHKAADIHYAPGTEGGAASAQVRQFEKWSAENGWVSRAAAWDRWVADELRRAHLEEVKAMRRRHAQLAETMAAKVVLRMGGGVDPITSKTVQAIDLDTLDGRTLARWADVAVKLERLSRGEPDSIVGAPEHDREAADEQQAAVRRLLDDPRLLELVEAMNETDLASEGIAELVDDDDV